MPASAASTLAMMYTRILIEVTFRPDSRATSSLPPTA